MEMKSQEPSAAALACREAMMTVMKQHADKLSGPELLAISAYTVGQLIALLDHRVFTSKKAMDLVVANIQAGNRHVVEQLAAVGGEAN